MSHTHSPEIAPFSRKIRSFVLRQGHLSTAQARALETLYPKFGLEFSKQPIDFKEVFKKDVPIFLEIGSGMGQATAEIAKHRPEDHFLAVEVHSPGVGSLLNLIENQELRNLRVIQHDAVEVLEHMIPAQSLSGVHIFFPDPWHKKRHHKRRLIQTTFLDTLEKSMKSNAYLHLATDWQEYAEHMLDVCRAHPAFENAHLEFAPKPDYRPLTKFEARGIARGHGVWDLVFIRKQRQPIDLKPI